MSTALRALASLSTTSPEYGLGLTDHAAMAVEALERIGPDTIDAFVARYAPRLRPLSAEPDPALADFARRVVEERAALERDGLAVHLSTHAAALADGFVGAAFHGAIRVAHAVRGLTRDPSPGRRDELARALAYAAIRRERLPPPVPSDGPGLSLPEALARLAPTPDALVHAPGLITATLLARATAHPSLREVAGRLKLADDPSHAARALRRAAVRLLTTGEHHRASLFTLLHGVTGMDAVCALVPHLDPAAARALVASAGHALLAVRVAYVGRLEVGAPTARASLPLLRDRAVRSLDDHAIKLAAALDEAEREGPDPHHAAALDQWLDALGA